MFKKSILFVITLYFNYPMWGQELNSVEYITVVAELIETKATGKRHNSFFFTFKIKEVLSGETNDSILVSQEIFHDFGAKQILSKTHPNNYNIYDGENKEGQEVVIKYWCKDSKLQLTENCNIKWVAEKVRRGSLESLEKLLESYSKKQTIINEYNLLTEHEGKLFFSDDSENWKVAVENYTGSHQWTIATIDK